MKTIISFITLFFGNTITLILGVFLCAVGHFLMRESVIEAGFGKKTKRRNVDKMIKNLPIMQRWILFPLCKKAPVSKSAAFFYCCLNLLIILCVPIILVNWIITFFTHDLKSAFLIGAGVPLGAVMLCTAIAFIPDLIFLPSERKRYGDTKGAIITIVAIIIYVVIMYVIDK